MGFLDFLTGKKERRMSELPKLEGEDSELLKMPSLDDIPTELPTFPSASSKEELKPARSIMPYSTEDFEKSIMRRERKELEIEKDHLNVTMPLFVKVSFFKDVMDEVGVMRAKLKEEEDALFRMSEFNNDQNAEFDKLKKQIEDIQRKLIFIDKNLFR